MESDKAVVEEVADCVCCHSDKGGQAVGAHHEVSGEGPLGRAKQCGQCPGDSKLYRIADSETDKKSQCLAVEAPTARMKDPQLVPQERVDHSCDITGCICNPGIDTEPRLKADDYNERE